MVQTFERCLFTAVWLVVGVVAAHGQSWRPPTDAQRCPSKWGPNDVRGSANHMSQETVLRAARLIRTGVIIELAHELSATMPLSGGRHFDLLTKRTTMNPQSNRRGSNEELVVAEIGQVGTQFDAFAHQTIGDRLYNCVPMDDVATRTGFSRLGVETVGTLMTRGVLIDVAAYKRVPVLDQHYEITPDDLKGALQRQKLSLQPGDAIIVHTGWGTLWEKGDARYYRDAPGVGIAAAEWLATQDPLLVGSDNWAVEISPNPDAQLSLPVHQIMLAVHGIHLLENMKLDEAAAAGAHEFALVLQPLKLKGGTGSTVAPVAIR